MSCDWYALTTDGVKSIRPYQPGKPIEELQRELGLSDIVKLASNENPLGPSSAVLRAISEKSKELTLYPDGSGYRLKHLLSQKFGVEVDQITLGNGSNDVLEMIANVFISEGDEVLISDHAFAVYSLVSKAVGAVIKMVPAKNWGHDLKAFSQEVTSHTKVVFLANPNNPTGTYFSVSELTKFLDTLPKNIIVVLDEAYTEYVSLAEYPDGLKLLNKYSNLIVTRTFSKAFGLAGLRLGYAVGHRDMTDLLNRVRQPFNVNLLAMEAATVVLDDEDYLQKSIDVNNSGMEQLVQGLKELNLSHIHSVGNFVCVNLNQSGAEIFNKLLKKGVIVRPVEEYGLPQFVRVSIGLEEENQRFLEALKQVLNS